MSKDEEKEGIEEEALEALYQVIDPEIGINIVDLGLVYEIECLDSGDLRVEMTLTTEGCPMGDVIQQDVQYRLEERLSDRNIELELTFEPPWSPEMISDAGHEMLG
jgi:metal-sulfur cluster biosynthetic enzyme